MIIVDKKNEREYKYDITLDSDTHIHVSNGNDKVGKGVACVNLMPGDGDITIKTAVNDNNPAGLLCNVAGTCTGCCDKCKGNCYAIKGAQYHHNSVVPAIAENTLLMRYDINRFFSELNDFFKYNLFSYCRIHSSGEFDNYEYFTRFIEFAKNHSEIKFYTYTKRFEFVEKYISDNGSLPENFVVNVSIWHKNYNNPCGLPEFIYDDHTEPELANVVHCPAVDCKGHKTGVTCAMCRRCINAKPGQKTAVYAH